MQFKFLWNLAFKNIARARRRSILTVGVLAFGVGMFIFMQGMMESFGGLSKQNLIEFETGDFKVYSAEFLEDRPYVISNFIQNPEEVEAQLDGIDYVTGYTERISFLGEVDSDFGSDVLTVVVTGVNPETDGSVFKLTNFFDEGGLEDGGAVLGKNLAEDLNVMLYDYINITFRNANGTYDSIEFEVSGILNAADPVANTSMVYITLGDAKEILATDGVTEIAVKTDDFELMNKRVAGLREILTDNTVSTWGELGKAELDFIEAKSGGGFTFVMMIIIIAIGGTINTMLLSVYEKQREIGMLKAMGMTARDIKRLFILEGLQMGLVGSLTGLVLGTLFNLPMAIWGLDFTKVVGGDASFNIGFRVMGTVKSIWSVQAYIVGFVGSVIATTLAAFLPAKQTVKMMPVECLRVRH